jgi:cytochrome c oxidase subunit II
VTLTARARLVGSVALVAVGAGACGGETSIVDPKGSEASRIAGVWWLMFGLAAGVYVVVAGCIIYAATRGRRRHGEESRLDHNRLIWIGGIAAPFAILAVLAVVTVDTTSALRNPSRDALHVEVGGELWWWSVRYPATNFETANEIHIPVGQPIDLTLRSDNVIHSFWVPELAGKEDVIPGQVNHLRFTADHPGRYAGRCAEFCGLEHAHMGIEVVVQTPGQFGRWMARHSTVAREPASEEAATGAVVFQRLACAGCHTIAGTPATGKVGPALTDVGARQLLGAGTVENTPENMRKWIRDAPGLKPGIVMPAFGSLSDTDLSALTAYLESLK